MRRNLTMFLAVVVMGGIHLILPPGARSQNPVASQRNLVMGCNSCHSLHGGSGFMLDPTATDTQDLCLTCHGAGNPLGLPVMAVHTNNAQTTTITCRICHNPHYSYWNGRNPNDNSTVDLRYGDPAFDADFWLNKKLIGTRLSVSGDVDSVTGQSIPPRVAVYAAPPPNSSNNADDWVPPSPRQVVAGIFDVLKEGSGQNAVYHSDWASEVPNPPENFDATLGGYYVIEAYNGRCNSCHTLTEHHQNSDTDTSADHAHNIKSPCTNCHDHAVGFRKGN